MCTLINFKTIKFKASQFEIIIITKLQIHVCNYAKLPNYRTYKFCDCIFAYLQVNAHVQFACF
jgi:hypothetical protein